MSENKQIMAVGFSGYSEGITKKEIDTILCVNKVNPYKSNLAKCGKHLQMPITCT